MGLYSSEQEYTEEQAAINYDEQQHEQNANFAEHQENIENPKMTKEHLFGKFGDVSLEFSEYSNGTVTYMKLLLNGDILIKHIHYGDEIISVSFSNESTVKYSEPEPYNFDVLYLPKGDTKNIVEFLSL